jgi:hypothetical protein
MGGDGPHDADAGQVVTFVGVARSFGRVWELVVVIPERLYW